MAGETRKPSRSVPRAAMWLDLAFGFVSVFFFRGWGTPDGEAVSR